MCNLPRFFFFRPQRKAVNLKSASCPHGIDVPACIFCAVQVYWHYVRNIPHGSVHFGFRLDGSGRICIGTYTAARYVTAKRATAAESCGRAAPKSFTKRYAAPIGGAAKNKNAADSVPDYKNFQKEEENASGGKRFLKPHRPEAPSSEISICHKFSPIKEYGKALRGK